MLRIIFGSEKEEVTVEWRKLHNEELNDLNSPPNTIQAVKSRRMRYVGQVAHMVKRRGANLKERDHLENPGIDERIILKCISRKWDGGHGLD